MSRVDFILYSRRRAYILIYTYIYIVYTVSLCFYRSLANK